MNGKQNHKISVIAFDADDTLWRELDLYVRYEQEFCRIMKPFYSEKETMSRLQNMEIKNVPCYGFGLKSAMLSMIEVLCNASGDVKAQSIKEVLSWGQFILNQPIELLEGVVETLQQLGQEYKLVLATKGDLLDQQRKIEKSGLKNYFAHIEVMIHKNIDEYKSLLTKLNCLPENFLMIGNSIKSDILPVLELGGYAIHIPYHITWLQEQHETEVKHERLFQVDQLKEIYPKLASCF